MGTKWKKAHPGIRFREHPQRKHGVNRDRYYTIYQKIDGRTIEEGLGWASEGWTVAKAAKILANLKENRKKGEGPRTLKEQREAEELARLKRKATNLTVSECWNDYQHDLLARVKPSSSIREIQEFTFRIKPEIGEKPLREVTSADIMRILDKMRADGLKPRTQEYLRGTFYRLWKHQATRKIVKQGDNPAVGIGLPKVSNTRLRVVTSSELKDMLDRLAELNPADHDMTLFCALTGCRLSESAKLTWEHVDLAREAAFFPETKNRDPREVHLSEPVLEMLRKKGHKGTGERVFLTAKGRPYVGAPPTFRTVVDELKLNENRKPLDRLTFHGLRHSAATYAARHGTPVKDLQVLFGWKTPSMIFRYAKGSQEIQRKALEGLAQTLTGEPAKVIPLRKTAKR